MPGNIKNTIKIKKTAGFVIVGTLVSATIAMILLTSVARWAGTNLKLAMQVEDREKAFQLAEAGIEYYRWHLAHAPQDFYDGSAGPGPYVHPYYDKMGNEVGRFELTITPPIIGSTVVTIRSKGVVDGSEVSRSLEAILAIPSLAKFAFVSNSAMRFGEGTEVYGPIHSNDGIRFDGLAHNLVTGGEASYDDPDHTGGLEFGVHTHVSPPPGTTIPDGGISSELASRGTPLLRPDVFMVGRSFPVPAVDWSGFTQDLATLKTLAQASNRYFPASGSLGYNIVLNTNGTFTLYRVTSLTSPPSGCYNPGGTAQTGWGSWSIRRQTLIKSYTYPDNGVMFFEDNIWVEGKIDNVRLTIASGKFPESESTNTSITFNKDILYTNYDGRDVLSLVAQNNINAGMVSDTDLQVDAALIAKNGRIGRYYYSSYCSPYHHRDSIRLFGMVASSKRYGFAYTDNTGYDLRDIVYDGNLLYGPPPSFPLTADKYQLIGWKEVPN